MGKFIDLSGKKFGDWRVMEQGSRNRSGNIMWLCKCVCGQEKEIYGSNLTSGKSKSCGCCLLYGVGVNDLRDFKSPYYLVWKRMLERCHCKSTKEINATYSDVCVYKPWLILSNFKSWMEKQDWSGLELDKDILVKDSRVYSPETCAFVPKRLNVLLGTSSASRGEFPLGVSRHSQALDRVQARSGSKYLGLFAEPVTAHKAWQNQKSLDIQNAISWYSEQDCFDTKVADALMTRAWNLLIDIEKSVETLTL